MKKSGCILLSSLLLLTALSACDGGSGEIITEPEHCDSTSEVATDKETTIERDRHLYSEEYKALQTHLRDPDSFSVKYDENDQITLYVKPWDEYFIHQTDAGENGHLFRRSCAAFTSDTSGIAVFSRAGESDTLEVIAVQKGSGILRVGEILLPAETWVYDLYCNFLNAQTGFLFVFEEYTPIMHASGTEALLLFRTDDGGVTWNAVPCDEPFFLSMKDSAIFAKFVNETVGIVSGRFWVSDFMEQRTYLTLDGGRSWEKLSPLPYLDYEGGHGSQIIDLELDNGIYTMTVRIFLYESGEEERVTFTSADMQTWKLDSVPESVPGFSSYEAIRCLFKDVTENVLSYDVKDGSAIYQHFHLQSDEEKAWFDALWLAVATNRSEDMSSYRLAFTNLNDDFVTELLLIHGDTVLAIFTKVDGRPILLDAFWNRYRGYITEEGLLYAIGSNGASNTSHFIYQLPKIGDHFELVEEFGTDGVAEDGTTLYYHKAKNSEKEMITQSEFDALCGRYSIAQ